MRDSRNIPCVRIDGVLTAYCSPIYALRVADYTGGEFVWWVKPTLWARLRGRGFSPHARDEEPAVASMAERAAAAALAMGWRPGEERITQECIDSLTGYAA